ncbi:hypothetical protein EI982_14125 [Haloplanus rallus]|uniref:Uncharacterized protein n=1 Tax=Haloplanus rallus TaxID=1816183 RepID=A0A6B9FAR7_9EURY|nr:hypothetical protein [Haloplanus rallus]QGX95837.1 hypothetical protein EI982_14125 [Haloplanus rallus]
MNDDDRDGERVVRCPVEGCDAEKLARGIHLHILRSSDAAHGDQGEYPDGVTLDNLEEVGRESVDVDYPESRASESVSRRCPYCRQHFSGKNGVLIHLGQLAGRKNHPEGASELHEPEDFAVIRLDEDENVISVVKNAPVVYSGDPDEMNESDGKEAFATFSREQMDHLYRVISDAGVEDERVKTMLQRPYIDHRNRE